jgi:hypothetical protein
MTDQKQQTTQEPATNPGPSKAVWDEALERASINPDNVAVYNVPDAE